MTKLGIITDLHSDIVALDAALARLKALGCELVVCAGDLVDGDVFPDEVIERLAEKKIPTIRGNHDRWALERAGELRSIRRREDLRADGPSSTYDGGDGLLGGGQDLSLASLRWLSRLPMSMLLEVEGVRVAVHHGRPATFGNARDMIGVDPRTTAPAQMRTLLDLAGADVLLLGHTHETWQRRVGGCLLANPGALWSGSSGVNREGEIYVPGAPNGGRLGVLELPSLRFTAYTTAGDVVLEPGDER